VNDCFHFISVYFSRLKPSSMLVCACSTKKFTIHHEFFCTTCTYKQEKKTTKVKKKLNDELRKVRTKIASRSCVVETCQDHPG
jgi:hypothetical protein